MTKKERLEALIAHYSEGKPTRFAKYIGVAPSTISTWLARDSFDYDLLFAKCEMISPDWLLTGKGPMQKGTTTLQQSNEKEPTPLLNQLLDTIKEQAEEIGQLKEQVRQLTIEKERLAANAQYSSTANVG